MEQQNHSQRKYNDDLDTVILDGVMNLEVEEELREKNETEVVDYQRRWKEDHQKRIDWSIEL